MRVNRRRFLTWLGLAPAVAGISASIAASPMIDSLDKPRQTKAIAFGFDGRVLMDGHEFRVVPVWMDQAWCVRVLVDGQQRRPFTSSIWVWGKTRHTRVIDVDGDVGGPRYLVNWTVEQGKVTHIDVERLPSA